MKKTLIALAAVAATGAAFAQSSVTLKGQLGVAYGATQDFAGVKANGFGVTDGDVVFAAVEDLGGGLKVSAEMGLKLRGRDNKVSAASTSTLDAGSVEVCNGNGNEESCTDVNVTDGAITTTTALTNAASNVVGGRDAKITLSGGFGSLMIGSIELANGILGRASAGAPTIGLDNGAGVDAAGNADIVTYSTPSMNGLSANVVYVDSLTNPAPAEGTQTSGSRAAALGVSYAAGPVSIGLDYTKYSGDAATSNNRTRVSASYNLGVATIGAGYQVKKAADSVIAAAENDGTNKQVMVGVSVPVGAITLGAVYAHHTAGAYYSLLKVPEGTKVKSYELGANYALSKRTNFQVAYQNMDASTVDKDATAFRARLLHSF